MLGLRCPLGDVGCDVGCGHHTGVLVWAFFASCRLPPYGLSELFTHKPEHLVWSLGQVCTFRPLPERTGLSSEENKLGLPQLVSVTLHVLTHLLPAAVDPS